MEISSINALDILLYNNTKIKNFNFAMTDIFHSFSFPKIIVHVINITNVYVCVTLIVQ